jgi:hypothetical protein
VSNCVLSASAVTFLIMGLDSMAHAQYIRSCGKVSPLAPQGAAPVVDSTGRPYTGTGFLEFIPSICVSERYDTNVFYAPPTPGLKRDDFVTDVNPMVRVNHNGEYASGYLNLGGFSENYVHNSNLNFFGTTDTLYLNLDNSLKRFLPNASFTFTDYVSYTPTPPGFSNVVAGTSPSSPANVSNVYAQGLLSYRANNLINNATALGSYKVTPLTSVNASYSNMILRFLSSPITTGALLFDTTTHIGTLGTKTEVSKLDILSVTYSYMRSKFTSSDVASSSAQAGTFTTNTLNLGWSRTLTPYLTAQIGGGIIVIDPGITTYAVNGSMTLNTPNNIATLSYGRSAYPNFYGVAVPLVSDVVSVTAIQKLALQWELDETANFSYASGASGPTDVSFTTYSAAIDLYYYLTRRWATALSFDYMNFTSESGPAKTNFNRYAFTLSIKATWN